MEKILIIAASAIIGAFSNRWRGGGFPNHTFMDKLGIPGNLLLYFAVSGFWVPTGSPWSFKIALMGVLAMAIGAAFGWGGYVGASFNGEISRKGDTPRIDRIIEKLEDRPFVWGIAGLSIRGILWSALLATPFFYADYFGGILYGWGLIPMFLAGAAMGPVFFLVGRAFDKLDLDPGTGWFSRWGVAEMVFGGILWGVMAAGAVC